MASKESQYGPSSLWPSSLMLNHSNYTRSGEATYKVAYDIPNVHTYTRVCAAYHNLYNLTIERDEYEDIAAAAVIIQITQLSSLQLMDSSHLYIHIVTL